MKDGLPPHGPDDGLDRLRAWLGSALAIGRSHLGLSLKDACRELAGVSDKTLMKWESGERLQPLSYAIELARRDEVTRRMLLQALGDSGPGTAPAAATGDRGAGVDDLARRLDRASSREDGERILRMVEAMLESALDEDRGSGSDDLSGA